MFRQVSQEAPCDNLASKGSSLENATVIVFDVREERLDDPNRRSGRVGGDGGSCT